MNQLEVQLSYLKGAVKAHQSSRCLRSSAMIWTNEEARRLRKRGYGVWQK